MVKRITNTILASYLEEGDYLLIKNKSVRIIRKWKISKMIMLRLYNNQIISRNERDEVKIVCK